jgi:hypothetical protein
MYRIVVWGVNVTVCKGDTPEDEMNGIKLPMVRLYVACTVTYFTSPGPVTLAQAVGAHEYDTFALLKPGTNAPAAELTTMVCTSDATVLARLPTGVIESSRAAFLVPLPKAS